MGFLFWWTSRSVVKKFLVHVPCGGCNQLCKRVHDGSGALNTWKLNIFNIIDSRISFCSINV